MGTMNPIRSAEQIVDDLDDERCILHAFIANWVDERDFAHWNSDEAKNSDVVREILEARLVDIEAATVAAEATIDALYAAQED